MPDAEAEFIKGMGVSRKQLGGLPDWMVKGDPPNNRIRMAFRNKLEPAINFGEFTMITFTPEVFARMCQMLPSLWKDMTKKS